MYLYLQGHLNKFMLMEILRVLVGWEPHPHPCPIH